jgi:hypothetical protein
MIGDFKDVRALIIVIAPTLSENEPHIQTGQKTFLARGIIKQIGGNHCMLVAGCRNADLTLG